MTLVADFNSSVNVPFQRMRQQQLDGALQEGVVGATDLKVVQRGAGANQSVDVGTGFAWVQIDTGTRNGMGHVTNDATANVTVTASDATNPRIDQIILRWNDTSIPTGSGNVPTLAVLTGTATSGATLDNRTGATALPNDCLRLADILVPATSTSVTTANIRDRRPWARGGYLNIQRFQNAAAGSNYTTTSASAVPIDATNLSPRLECSGAPLRFRLSGMGNHSVATAAWGLRFYLDSTQVDSHEFRITNGPGGGGAAGNNAFSVQWTTAPAAGSHIVAPYYIIGSTAGTVTVTAAAGFGLQFEVEEIVRSNANNT